MAAVVWPRTRQRKQASGLCRGVAAQKSLWRSAAPGPEAEAHELQGDAETSGSSGLRQLAAHVQHRRPAYTSEVGMGDTAARGAGAEEESTLEAMRKQMNYALIKVRGARMVVT